MVGAMPPEAALALPLEAMSGYVVAAKHLPPKQAPRAEADECEWYGEDIDDDLKLCYALNRFFYATLIDLH